MSHFQELAAVAAGSTMATVGGFGSALLAYVNEAPSAITGGAFFVGLAGVCTALTPLVLKAIDALRLKADVQRLNIEVAQLKASLATTETRERANREWMIATAAGHSDVELPQGFILVPVGKCPPEKCPNHPEAEASKPKAETFDDPDRAD